MATSTTSIYNTIIGVPYRYRFVKIPFEDWAVKNDDGSIVDYYNYVDGTATGQIEGNDTPIYSPAIFDSPDEVDENGDPLKVPSHFFVQVDPDNDLAFGTDITTFFAQVDNTVTAVGYTKDLDMESLNIHNTIFAIKGRPSKPYNWTRFKRETLVFNLPVVE